MVVGAMLPVDREDLVADRTFRPHVPAGLLERHCRDDGIWHRADVFGQSEAEFRSPLERSARIVIKLGVDQRYGH